MEFLRQSRRKGIKDDEIWDSSAIVPLLVLEIETEQCIRALQSDKEVMVWTMSKVEVFSALCRRVKVH